MEKYISFELSQADATNSQFIHYTLGATSLLPYYFGSVAPVNIFLGENNSGKSRFMREIMKSQPNKIFNLNINPKDILPKIRAITNSIDDPTIPMLYDITVYINDINTINSEFAEIIVGENATDERINLVIKTYDLLENLKHIVNDTFKRIENTNDTINKITKNNNYFYNELTSLVFRINRARNLYNVFAHSNVYGFIGHRKYDSTFQLIAPNYSLAFDVKYKPERFEIEAERSKHTDKTIEHFDKILNACKVVLDILKPLALVDSQNQSTSYIPTLRTARTFIDNNGKRLDSSLNIMKHTTSRDYGLENLNTNIITGFELYDAILGKYAARDTKRRDLANFQNFLSEAFFNGQHVEIVPEQVADSRGGNILITVGKQERDIHHLGDGIQAIIVLLYPLFFAKKGEWFFIEEPETHLHPGFQRLFIKTITKNQSLLDKELTVFMTTHSNHILDFAIDEAKSINLFTFRKTQEENEKSAYEIQLTKQGDLASLNVLGVQNSSVFLSNCTIWLEGVTDRIYLAAYLKAYLAHAQSKFSLIEGLHYSFLEYAGSNVMHYDFEAQAHDSSITPQALQDIKALSISNRILLIADQDGGKKTKRDTQLSGQQHAGFEYRVLDVREIENLLSREVIVAALQKMYPKETFDVALLDAADYKDEYLGAYLRGKYPSIPDNFAPADGSGTIGSAKKRIFAERAAEAITSWGDLTPEAQQLTEQVYQFIVGHNPRLTSH